jgi:hypothetical protein
MWLAYNGPRNRTFSPYEAWLACGLVVPSALLRTTRLNKFLIFTMPSMNSAKSLESSEQADKSVACYHPVVAVVADQLPGESGEAHPGSRSVVQRLGRLTCEMATHATRSRVRTWSHRSFHRLPNSRTTRDRRFSGATLSRLTPQRITHAL